MLWTRVETDAEVETVHWELSQTDDFEFPFARGKAEARVDADHTVKVIPKGLSVGATFYYRFRARGVTSPIGRTKTLPDGELETLGIALASCSNYAFGYFNAYDAIARDESIDIVLHTGDYIYEYGAKGWGAETARTVGRRHQPAHETVTLADYRQRHAQYKRDAGSLAMHAAHPFVACWDDHESTNNPWMGGAQNHQPEEEGDWEDRRDASLQAYYEWMPIREPQEGRTRAEFWRSYSFGGLATLVTLETRHTARGEQVDYADHFDAIQTKEDRDAFMSDVIGDPERRMISEGMEDALRFALWASVQGEQPWRIIGNASPIARMLTPDIVAMGVDPERQEGAGEPGATADLSWKGQWNLPFYTDTWDGYPAAREDFYALCRNVQATDLLVLTGDSHSFWANRLFDGEGRPMGVEIGTAGISSPGDFVESGWDAESAEQLDRAFEEALDEVRWTDNFHQGYVRVVLTTEAADVTYVAVDTVLITDYRTFDLRTERIVREGDSLVYEGETDEPESADEPLKRRRVYEVDGVYEI